MSHGGGGAGGGTPPAPPPPLDIPPPPKRLCRICLRAFGQSNIISGAFGANSFRAGLDPSPHPLTMSSGLTHGCALQGPDGDGPPRHADVPSLCDSTALSPGGALAISAALFRSAAHRPCTSSSSQGCIGRGGLGWVGLGQGLAWSPTHGPRRLPCGTRLGGRTRVSGHKAYRTVDRPQTPRWRSRAGDAAVLVCMCPCVSGGGGGLWHTCLLHCCSALAHMARGSVCLVLQAPAGRLESLTLSPPGEMWAWARNLHVTRTCYPTTPRLPIGTGRRWYVARLGSDPHSLTALGTGGAASRAGSGSHGRGHTLGRWRGTRAQSVLPCPGCHQCWLHWLRRYSPRRRGGPEGTTPEWPLR